MYFHHIQVDTESLSPLDASVKHMLCLFRQFCQLCTTDKATGCRWDGGCHVQVCLVGADLDLLMPNPVLWLGRQHAGLMYAQTQDCNRMTHDTCDAGSMSYVMTHMGLTSLLALVACIRTGGTMLGSLGPPCCA